MVETRLRIFNLSNLNFGRNCFEKALINVFLLSFQRVSHSCNLLRWLRSIFSLSEGLKVFLYPLALTLHDLELNRLNINELNWNNTISMWIIILKKIKLTHYIKNKKVDFNFKNKDMAFSLHQICANQSLSKSQTGFKGRFSHSMKLRSKHLFLLM